MTKTFTPATLSFFILMWLLLAVTACTDRTKLVTTAPYEAGAGEAAAQAALTRKLLLQKLHIDALTLDTLAATQVFTKVPDQEVPLLVRNSQYPKKIEAIFQVCKDSTGRIVYLAESPYSESGEWDIVYRSYFDAQGRIFVFERTAGFFNSSCTSGALYETMTRFFNVQGQVVATEKIYQDEDGQHIQNKPCDFPYNFPYEVVTDVNTYCRKLKLRL